MLRSVGALPVVVALLLTLTVTVLRLAAVPLALAAIALDRAATLAAAPLSFTTPTTYGEQR